MRKIILLLLLISSMWAQAQPLQGDVFKEYRWFNEEGDCNGALRVGGNLDYQLQKNVINYLGDGLIAPPYEVDLKRAIRAELLVEKMLCHGGTKGLRVKINNNQSIEIPEPEKIPVPRSSYPYHYNALIDVDLSNLKEGDGLYKQWHYSYHKCQIYNHIGAIDQLKLKRRGISVELCKPYQRPNGWFTRNGIYINDFIVFTKEGPKYDYFEHHVLLQELHCLKQGKNILKTGLTPLYPEGMVHGAEVQRPGIMLLIQYDTTH